VASPRVIERDAAVDFVKAACLLVVVGLHALMAGITVGSSGLAITNALEFHPIFAWSTWAVQVMPLFFLLGGFASVTQWRRMKGEGATAGDYIRRRVQRLAHPALLPIGIVGGGLAAVALAGVPDEVVREVGFRIGQPLWFLAVYLGCSGFVPFLSKLHDRRPLLTLLGLLALAITFDTASQVIHPGIGYINMLVVWLFVQQLGFWYADGWFLRRNRWLLLGLAFAAFGTLVFLTQVVGYSVDMYINLNPPTVCILVLGIGQLLLFSWAHPWLLALAQKAPVKRASNAVNLHSMTIYLWHVPVVVIVALTMMTARVPFPEPLSATWWETRPLFLGAIAVGLIPVVLLVAYYDRSQRRQEPTTTSPWLAALKVILSVTGVSLILIAGFSSAPAVAIALALLILAVYLQSARKKAPPPLPSESLEGDVLRDPGVHHDGGGR
jgi:hypothetical protein